MKIIIPVTIDDTTFTSSTVADSVYTPHVHSTGTLTLVSIPALAETFVVGDQTFTIVVSGTALGNVVRDVDSVTEQAERIVTSINRDIPSVVAATNLAGVVTITAVTEGVQGNSIVLTTACTGMTASGTGTLSGGVDEIQGKVEWSALTTYGIGDEVVITATHTLYESLKGSNLDYSPADNLGGDDPYWLELGKTNRWKMFDTTVTSQTSNPESIVVVVTPAVEIDSITLLNVNGASVGIVMNDPISGEVYNETVIITATVSSTVVKTDLPAYKNATLTVTITNSGANATCGMFVIGSYVDLGTTLYGPTISLLDYSIKEVDDFGNCTITERAFSKRLECDILVSMATHSSIKRTLALYRATPLVWIASTLYSVTVIYGFYNDFSMTLENPSYVRLNLQIEGLI